MGLFNVRTFVFVALTAGMLAGCGMITGSRGNTRGTDADRAAMVLPHKYLHLSALVGVA